MAEDETFLELPNFLGTPTPERMAEIAREIARELDAMTPEQRAAHLTKQTFDRQKDDEKLFADMSRGPTAGTGNARGLSRQHSGAYPRWQQASYTGALTLAFHVAIPMVGAGMRPDRGPRHH